MLIAADKRAQLCIGIYSTMWEDRLLDQSGVSLVGLNLCVFLVLLFVL